MIKQLLKQSELGTSIDRLYCSEFELYQARWLLTHCSSSPRTTCILHLILIYLKAGQLETGIDIDDQ